MTTPLTAEQVTRADEIAKKQYLGADYDTYVKCVADGVPLPAALLTGIPVGSNLEKMAKYLATSPGTVKATTVKALATSMPLVNPNATNIVRRVRDFASGKELPTIAAGTEVEAEDLTKAMPDEVSALALEGRSMILGVTPVSLFAEFLAVIAAARESMDPVPLVMAGVFAVTEGYTVASAWADRYPTLPKPHPFTKFEVDGRKAVKGADGSAIAGWVASSKMNSSAVHILGHMIVDAAPDNSFLKTVKEQAGTMFSPPPADDLKERSKIMNETAKTLTDADKSANKQFADNFQKYVKVVAMLFGKGDGSYERLFNALKNAPVVTI